MTAPKPSDLAFIRFVSVENMMRLVNSIGVETALRDLARLWHDPRRLFLRPCPLHAGADAWRD